MPPLEQHASSATDRERNLIASLSEAQQKRLFLLVGSRLGAAYELANTIAQRCSELKKQLDTTLGGAELEKFLLILHKQKRIIGESIKSFGELSKKGDIVGAILLEPKFRTITGNTVEGLLRDGKTLLENLKLLASSGGSPGERWRRSLQPLTLRSKFNALLVGDPSEQANFKDLKSGRDSRENVQLARTPLTLLPIASAGVDAAFSLGVIGPELLNWMKSALGEEQWIALPRRYSISEKELADGLEKLKKYLTDNNGATYIGFISRLMPQGYFSSMSPGERLDEEINNQRPVSSNPPVKPPNGRQATASRVSISIYLPAQRLGANGLPEEYEKEIVLTAPPRFLTRKSLLSDEAALTGILSEVVKQLTEIEKNKPISQLYGRAFYVMTQIEGIDWTTLCSVLTDFLSKNREINLDGIGDLGRLPVTADNLRQEELQRQLLENRLFVALPLANPHRFDPSVYERASEVLIEHLQFFEKNPEKFSNIPSYILELLTLAARNEIPVSREIYGEFERISQGADGLSLTEPLQLLFSLPKEAVSDLIETLSNIVRKDEGMPEWEKREVFHLLLDRGFSIGAENLNWLLRLASKNPKEGKEIAKFLQSILTELSEHSIGVPPETLNWLARQKISRDLLAKVLESTPVPKEPEPFGAYLDLLVKNGIKPGDKTLQLIRERVTSLTVEFRSGNFLAWVGNLRHLQKESFALEKGELLLLLSQTNLKASFLSDPTLVGLVVKGLKQCEVSPTPELVDAVLQLDSAKHRRNKFELVSLAVKEKIADSKILVSYVDRLNREYGKNLTREERTVILEARQGIAPPTVASDRGKTPDVAPMEPVVIVAAPKPSSQPTSLPAISPRESILYAAQNLRPKDKGGALSLDERINELKPDLSPADIVTIFSAFSGVGFPPPKSSGWLLERFISSVDSNPDSIADYQIDTLAHRLIYLKVFHPGFRDLAERMVGVGATAEVRAERNSLFRYLLETASGPPLDAKEVYEALKLIRLKELGRTLKSAGRWYSEEVRKVCQEIMVSSAPMIAVTKENYGPLLALYQALQWSLGDGKIHEDWQSLFDSAWLTREGNHVRTPGPQELQLQEKVGNLIEGSVVETEAPVYGYRVDFKVEVPRADGLFDILFIEIDGARYHQVMDLSPDGSAPKSFMTEVVREETLQRVGRVLHWSWDLVRKFLADETELKRALGGEPISSQ